MEERKRYPVEFRGGQWWSVVPMLIFLVFCVVYFVGFKVFDMNALAVGGFLGLLIGALFCKTYGAYWDAVLRGIGSSTSVSIVVILPVIGMFTKLMAISGVSQGFVWMAHMVGMPGSIFTAFTFLAACLITTATGSSIGTLTTVFPILYPAGILLGSHPAILPFISAFIFISASSIEPLLEEYSYLPAVTPLQIFSGAFYPMVLFVVLTVSILTGWDRIYEGPDGAILHKKP